MGSAPVDEVTLKTSFAAKTGVSKITAALTKNLIVNPPSSLYNTIKIEIDYAQRSNRFICPAKLFANHFTEIAHTNYLQ